MNNRNFVFFVSFLVCFVLVSLSILSSSLAFSNPLLALSVGRMLYPRLMLKELTVSEIRSIGVQSSLAINGIIGSVLTGVYFSNDKDPEIKNIQDPETMEVSVIFNPNPDGKTAVPGSGYSNSETMASDPKQPKPNNSYTINYPKPPSSYIDIARSGGGGPYKNNDTTTVTYSVVSVESCTPNPGGAWCGNIASHDAEQKSFKAVYKHIAPATCRAGYVPSAGECVLQLEEIVVKPDDELACDVIEGTNLYEDIFNPECYKLSSTGALKVSEHKMEVDGEEVKTEIEKIPGGGHKITTTDKKTGDQTSIETKKYDKSKGGSEITKVTLKPGNGSGTGNDSGTGSGSGSDSGSGSGDGEDQGVGDGEGAGGQCGIEGKPDCKVDVDDSAFDESWNPEVEKQNVLDEEKAGFESFVNAFSFENNFGVDLSKFFDQIDILPERNCSPLVLSFLGKELRIELCQKLEPIRIILGYLIWVVLVIGLFHLFIRTTADNRTQ